MKARITVQVCDLCGGFTSSVLEQGGIEIPTLAVHFGTGGDCLKDVFICDSCARSKSLPLLELYRQIEQTRTENQS